MGGGEREQPRLEGLPRRHRVGGHAQRLMGDRLHGRQRVLDPVVELVDEPSRILKRPPLPVDVDHRHDAAARPPRRRGSARPSRRSRRDARPPADGAVDGPHLGHGESLGEHLLGRHFRCAPSAAAASSGPPTIRSKARLRPTMRPEADSAKAGPPARCRRWRAGAPRSRPAPAVPAPAPRPPGAAPSSRRSRWRSAAPLRQAQAEARLR